MIHDLRICYYDVIKGHSKITFARKSLTALDFPAKKAVKTDYLTSVGEEAKIANFGQGYFLNSPYLIYPFSTKCK